jgi:hypothetical protein
MTTTFSTVRNILRRELLVPVRKLRSRQVLTSDVGLTAFELNALLYFIEEKYQFELKSIRPGSTVQELVDSIDKTVNH